MSHKGGSPVEHGYNDNGEHRELEGRQQESIQYIATSCKGHKIKFTQHMT